MRIQKLALISAILLSAVACEQNQHGGITKADVGTVAGAALGAWAGHNIGGGSGQVVATAAGTLIGAMIGREFGENMDQQDMLIAESTSQRALETAQPGQTLPWSNPQSGHSGSVTPSNYYQMADGRYCREYTQTVTVAGQKQQAYGTACRQEDGTWEIVN